MYKTLFRKQVTVQETEIKRIITTNKQCTVDAGQMDNKHGNTHKDNTHSAVLSFQIADIFWTGLRVDRVVH